MDVRAKKHLGQHFLTGPGIAASIANAITLHNGCTTALEVGPGTGALTKPLIARGDLDLHVVELDEESVDYLITEVGCWIEWVKPYSQSINFLSTSPTSSRYYGLAFYHPQ